MTRPESASGGETPGGKTCCSPDLLTAAVADWARAGCAAYPLRGTWWEVLAYTVTNARCVAITACSVCHDVAVTEVARHWPTYS
jgi:hypothetical protein